MCDILNLAKVPPPTNAWHSPFNTCQRPKYVWNSPGPVMVPVKVCTLPWFPCHLSSITANPVICRLSLQSLTFVVYHCKSCHLTSITASQCFFCLSRPILFRLDFPVHNHSFCPFPTVPRPVLSFPVLRSLFLSSCRSCPHPLCPAHQKLNTRLTWSVTTFSVSTTEMYPSFWAMHRAVCPFCTKR